MNFYYIWSNQYQLKAYYNYVCCISRINRLILMTLQTWGKWFNFSDGDRSDRMVCNYIQHIMVHVPQVYVGSKQMGILGLVSPPRVTTPGKSSLLYVRDVSSTWYGIGNIVPPVRCMLQKQINCVPQRVDLFLWDRLPSRASQE